MNNLSKRLKTIANLVSGRIIADVGCDHGKLSYYLLKNQIVDFAYVSDISKPSLEKAEALLSNNNLNFKAIWCDGLKGYKEDNIDECIITGMGGEEIIKIIKASPVNIKSFILSPQHNITMLKEFMLEKGFDITFDIIIKDKNKFYNIIKFQLSDKKKTFTEFDLQFGKENFINNLDFIEYLDREIKIMKICLI